MAALVITGDVQAFAIVQDRDGTRVVELGEVWVGDARIRRRDAILELDGDGTVNADPVTGARRLVPGDVIASGSAIAIIGLTRGRHARLSLDPAIERALTPAAAPMPASAPQSQAPELRAHLGEIERAAIVAAMAASGGNQTQAAANLGISRRTLIYRLEKYGLKPAPPR